jgi:hypothetical protein
MHGQVKTFWDSSSGKSATFWKRLDFFNPLKDSFPPPWVAFPSIDPESMFWSMGRDETYWAEFDHYFSSLSERDRAIYQLTNPVPADWNRHIRGYDQAQPT